MHFRRKKTPTGDTLLTDISFYPKTQQCLIQNTSNTPVKKVYTYRKFLLTQCITPYFMDFSYSVDKNMFSVVSV